MKIVKKVLSVLLIFCCFSSTILPTFATDIQPQSDNASNVTRTFDIDSNGIATCYINMVAYNPDYKVCAVIKIYRINGSESIEVASWSVGNSNVLSETKTCNVTRGFTYKMTTAITVRNSSNKVVETVPTPPMFAS